MNHVDYLSSVRGRNSDNRLIQDKLGWAPALPLKEGLAKTYAWISSEVEKAKVK